MTCVNPRCNKRDIKLQLLRACLYLDFWLDYFLSKLPVSLAEQKPTYLNSLCVVKQSRNKDEKKLYQTFAVIHTTLLYNLVSFISIITCPQKKRQSVQNYSVDKHGFQLVLFSYIPWIVYFDTVKYIQKKNIYMLIDFCSTFHYWTITIVQ